MKSFASTLLFSLATPIAAIACVSLPMTELTESDYGLLSARISQDFPRISAGQRMRSSDAYGFPSRKHVTIEYEPHRVEDGIQFYFAVDCSFDSDEWVCVSIEERSGIQVDDSMDFVEIPASLNRDKAVRIVESIRREIVVDSDGRYSYSEWGSTRVSDQPLDILKIHSLDRETYTISAAEDILCAEHSIEVREVQCGVEDCSFEIVKNEIEHYL